MTAYSHQHGNPTMPQRTALFQHHLKLGAKMVEFAGWDMPLHYGSQVQEHHAVRGHAGLFDVSHMSVFDLHGGGCLELLRLVLANDVARLIDPGQALYSCLLNPRGGVIDDLIVYFMGTDDYRIVANASTHDTVMEHIRQHAHSFDARLRDRGDLAMLAIQGPEARERLCALLPDEARQAAQRLVPFSAYRQGEHFISRTGYTGEDGFELIQSHPASARTWEQLCEVAVQPCGLGARDTLRLEAGLNLYGTDMNADITPLECGLGWTVAWEPLEREFIGRAALQAQWANSPPLRRMGLRLQGKGLPRAGQEVLFAGRPQGVITSGGFSPTLNTGIALARLPHGASGDVEVVARGRHLPARIVKPPFVRAGKAGDIAK